MEGVSGLALQLECHRFDSSFPVCVCVCYV